MTADILEERKKSIISSDFCCQGDGSGISCEKESVSGAVSQRACVYCGARVVLNPITDAFHIIHGPIGCSSYTWDIRGSLTSGSDVFRNSFSTDLKERDIIFGGTKILEAAVDEVVAKHGAKLIFVYATCIVGVIGDDIEAVCRAATEKYKILVIPVKAPGFSGTKSQGYKLACDAIMKVIAPAYDGSKIPGSINILGDYNLSGEMWIIEGYLKKIGIKVNATITGDASMQTLQTASKASLNIVQCAGSSTYLAKRMEEEWGIPFIKVSFFGVEDTSNSILRVAQAVGNKEVIAKAEELTQTESAGLQSFLDKYKPRLVGKKAAIYVGGGFKAISLIRQFNELGIETVVVGTQTGQKEDYDIIRQLSNSGTIIMDDANPSELETFMKEKKADILVGGVKERPLAYKLGIAFCDHNHERKHALAGYEGVRNFVEEINLSINSPVWDLLD
ncbi:Nitrogenase molybdenum-iron protein alpha chain [bioreactor metagenome]|uniref:Nitrogenase iron-molybdenum cofactor biosynthesis protein NifE n=1 Tax=bioreactor metagenome TaxID=1076179 RepID=A0A644V4P2_9ZZZZ|nr:nitrogenase iron-molybdenum cofactor biosynthesis protein NifE [Lachnospiraceae bacterium]MEA5092107.1 nitrogenase iron-molybdenum cofactor biosynthesis protein NifE [Acidaminococcaceae bacterium]